MSVRDAMPGPVLAFDTSARHCAAALLIGDDIAASLSEELGRGQAERLFPMLEEVLALGAVGWAELAAIGVGTGPGNFTGIRISVAAARGLALSLDIPARGINAFDVAQFGLAEPAVAIVPALRGQVYARVPEASPTLMSPEQARSLELPVAELPAPRLLAETIARMAAAGHGVTPPAPLYVRAPDAAPPAARAPAILPDDT